MGRVSESSNRTAVQLPPITPEQMAALLDGVSGICAMAEAPKLRYVPTDLCSLNRAFGVGGCPVGRSITIHGPTDEGKTALVVSLMKSFAVRGHVALFVDAECKGDPHRWFKHLGLPLNESFYMKPHSFEEARSRVDRVIKNLSEGKKKGIFPREMCLLLAIDSVNKLRPAKEVDLLLKEEDVEGRKPPVQALLIQAWLDEITPMLDDHGVALVMVAQERDPVKISGGPPSYIPAKPKVKGAQAIMYDVAIRARVTKKSDLVKQVGGTRIVVGKEISVKFEKCQIGRPGEEARFYLSNGLGDVPEGFDSARELFQELLHRGLAQKAGKGSYTIEGWGAPMQMFAILQKLREDESLFAQYKAYLDQTVAVAEAVCVG